MTRGKSIATALLVLAAAVSFYFLWRAEAAAPIVGVVRTTEIRVAPEVGGQLVAIKVEPGARVRVGDVVAELSAVELTASVGQARAQLAAAKASRDNVYAGVRAEQVASLAAEIAKAKARLDYTQAQLTVSAPTFLRHFCAAARPRILPGRDGVDRRREAADRAFRGLREEVRRATRRGLRHDRAVADRGLSRSQDRARPGPNRLDCKEGTVGLPIPDVQGKGRRSRNRRGSWDRTKKGSCGSKARTS